VVVFPDFSYIVTYKPDIESKITIDAAYMEVFVKPGFRPSPDQPVVHSQYQGNFRKDGHSTGTSIPIARVHNAVI
jgi:hypothetical protein